MSDIATSSSSSLPAREVGGTRRPDGTFRKVVKVREGFASEELDASRRAYKSRGTLELEARSPPVAPAGPSAAALARAEKRKRKAAAKREAWLAAGGKGEPPKEGDGDEDGDEVEQATNGVAKVSITPAATV